MSSTLFFLSRLFSIFLVVIEVFRSISIGFTCRDTSFYIASLLFLLVSYIYEDRKRYFSVGFTFYFIVIYLAHLWSPYYYIYDSYIQTLDEVKPPDYYWIFWKIFMIISIVILLYLMAITKVNKKAYDNAVSDICLKYKLRSKQMLITMLCLLPIWYIGINNEIVKFLMVFFTTYFISVFYLIPVSRKNNYVIFGCIISLIIILYLVTWRFIFVKYFLPLVFMFILKQTDYRKSINSKSLRVIAIGGTLVLLYGIISEINKLNLRKSDISLISEIISTFTSIDTVEYWASRQLYRIITIWTVLGGNIIEYVHQNGFFYGITYVKFLAPYLNFEYVSLPVISANIIGASYAQPGVVVEGYANWGIFGAVLNCLCIFFIMELLWNYYYRTRKILFLIIYFVSFSQVILDGGTINSVLFLCIISLFSFYILDILKIKRISMNERTWVDKK